MVIFFSISSGLLIIVISLLLIRKEFLKATKLRNSNFSGLNDTNVKEVVSYLDRLEVTIEEVNQSFYEIANDLEEKFSMHNKEIEIIDQKVNDINLLTNELSKLLKFQGKELALLKREEITPILSDNTQNQNIEHDTYVTEKEVTHIGETDISNYRLPSDKVKNDTETLKDEIMKLKALGMDDNQIAKNLNKGVREIKMLMNFIK